MPKGQPRPGYKFCQRCKRAYLASQPWQRVCGRRECVLWRRRQVARARRARDPERVRAEDRDRHRRDADRINARRRARYAETGGVPKWQRSKAEA